MVRRQASFPSAWLAGLVYCATFAAYLPAIRGGLIWDDDAHVTKPALRSLHGLGQIWFSVGATQQYYPVLHSAFWIEHRLWGDNTLGYHVVNILLHATAACLFALILTRLWTANETLARSTTFGAPVAGRVSVSFAPWLAALIFALHPVCVESVAWISEQKNTLSAVFYLLAAYAYLRKYEVRSTKHEVASSFVPRPSYFLSTLLFILALLSKSVTATLPAALLVVIWWKKGRLSWRRDVLPLVPWFAMALAFGLVTAWYERRMIELVGVPSDLNWLQRGLLAGRAIGFYLGKLFWPADLIFIYPRWNLDPGVLWQWLYPFGALALLAVLWLRPFGFLKKWGRGPLAGFLFFAGTLLPALGFVDVLPFRYSFVADHFQYLASLGVIAVVAAAITKYEAAGVEQGNFRRFVFRTSCFVLLPAVLGVLTFKQSRNYRDIETIYRATLDRNPGCWMIRSNLGAHLLDTGRPAEAAVQLREAIATNPGTAETHYNLGNALLALGRLQDAIPEFEEADRLNPRIPEIEIGLGNALYQAGRMAEAGAHFTRALEAQPDSPELREIAGIAFTKAGRLPEGAAQFEAAVRLKPDNAAYHFNLGAVLNAMGRTREGEEQLQRAAELDPHLPVNSTSQPRGVLP